jgi:hypothetical protein
LVKEGPKDFEDFMITIDRIEYDDQSWTRDVSDALKRGTNVTLKNFRYDSDMNLCQEIGKVHQVKVTLHLDHTVCCFEKIVGQKNR